MRLSDSQLRGLELLEQAHLRAEQRGLLSARWIGARESVSGTTIEALERRGLARAAWVEQPYCRVVGCITEDGLAELERRRTTTKGGRHG